MKQSHFKYFIKIKLIIFMVLIVTYGCEKETSLNIPASIEKSIVIEGMLTNESKAQEIKISWTVSGLNELPTPVSGALVKVSDGSNIVSFSEDIANPGIYKTTGNYSTTLGKTYYLTVIYAGKIYTATTLVEKGQYFEDLKYTKDVANNRYHITWVCDPYHAIKSAMYEVSLDWSNLPAYASKESSKCKAKMLFYTLPTIDVSQVFAPDKQVVEFPLNSQVVEKRYSLTPDYAQYVRALMLSTNWQGGYFDSAPANLPTNISGGAIGYFTAASVITSSFIITE